jgi:hypothetical protein
MFRNAKEPDVFAELPSFSRRFSAFIRLFPPVRSEKNGSFFRSYAHRFFVASSMWERGCIGSAGFEAFSLSALFVSSGHFFLRPCDTGRTYI